MSPVGFMAIGLVAIITFTITGALRLILGCLGAVVVIFFLTFGLGVLPEEPEGFHIRLAWLLGIIVALLLPAPRRSAAPPPP